MTGFARFDCYPSDYLNGLVGMTADEIAAYTVIIMLQYDGGGPVKYEGRERELSVRAGMPRGRLGKAIAGLLTSGKIESESGSLFNRRAMKEISKISEKIFKNRENSLKGGIANAKNFEGKDNKNNEPVEPNGYPNGYPFDSPNYLHINQYSITKRNTIDCPKRVRTQYPEDFEKQFWQAYPTDANMSKKAALDVWKRLGAEDRMLAIESVPAFRAYCEANPDYRPIHAERYLSKRRFEGHAELGRKISTQVFVVKGTSAWTAWAKARGKEPPTTKNPNGGGDGWMFPSEFPPAQQASE